MSQDTDTPGSSVFRSPYLGKLWGCSCDHGGCVQMQFNCSHSSSECHRDKAGFDRRPAFPQPLEVPRGGAPLINLLL
ncbi:hypothetical protein E2C01_069780 [Portunus trituberculatus]|uniref:Uncharacterized protein n=1 Tax=Portunus trituberculatus TaxID=210409 RepID=A0A5B7HZG7_PORTR|nr:hypothetical protein [Portunus trituberculatus]